MPALTLRDRLAALILPVLDGEPMTPEAAAEMRRLLGPPPPPWPYDCVPHSEPRAREEAWGRTHPAPVDTSPY